MSLPLVSVITPLYNYEQYIAQAIESVLNQTYPNLEMIVVDDGSSDQGPEIVARYRGERVKLFKQERMGCGVARALNRAIAESQGEYISWLSADDYYLPTKLARNVEVFQSRQETHPRLGLLHSQPGVESAEPDYLAQYCPLPVAEQQRQLAERGAVTWPFGAGTAEDRDMLFYSLLCNQINGCTTLIPKKVFEAVGPFKNSWSVTQDYEMWLRILLAGYEVSYLPEVLTVSRFHPVNTGQYSQIVPAEANLVMRSAKERIQLSQIEDSLRRQGISTSQFPLWYAPLLARQGIYDEALYTLEHAVLPAVEQAQAQALRAQLLTELTPPELAPYSLKLPLRWGLTLSRPALKSHRLLAVLTEFCAAFGPQSEVALSIWAEEPDLKAELPSLLENWKTQIAAYLKRELADLPPLELAQGELGAFLEALSAYLPIGNPDLLEQRCLYSKRAQSALIQWAAEAFDFRRAAEFLKGLATWHLPLPQPLSQVLWPETSIVAVPGPERSFVFSTQGWLELSEQDALAKVCAWQFSASGAEKVSQAEYACLPLPEKSFFPAWAPNLNLPLELEDLAGDVILIVYAPENGSAWRESLQAFLAEGLNQPDLSLLFLVLDIPEASSERDAIYEEVFQEIEAAGVDPENIENIVISYLDRAEAMGVFQLVWLWLQPVADPAQWLPFWPYLAQSETALLSLNWLAAEWAESAWISFSSNLEDLRSCLRQALADREATRQRGRALNAKIPRFPAYEAWLKGLLDHFAVHGAKQ